MPNGRGKLVVVAYQKLQKRLKYSGAAGQRGKEPLVVHVEPDASNAWRLDEVVQLIKVSTTGRALWSGGACTTNV